MICSKCLLNNLEVHDTADCLNIAVKTIQQQFQKIHKLIEVRDKEISLLKELNKNLSNRLQNVIENGPKRRKLCTTPNQNESISKHDSDRSLPLSDCNSPATSSELNLNVALSSQQLLNISAVSPTTPNDTIAETEKVRSPSGAKSVRRKLLRSDKNTSHCENQNPKTNAKISGSMSKLLEKSAVEFDSFRMPQVGEKKILSLKRQPHKSKQSKLDFDVKQNKTDNIKTTSEKVGDIIDETPNLYTSLKQAKQTRSFLQSSSNSKTSINKSNIKKSSQNVLLEKKCNVANVNNSEHFFDFNTPQKLKISKPQTVEEFKTPEKTFFASGSSDTPSVMLITPTTQDIIFIDDDDENTQITKDIGTMDLMSELLKSDDNASLKTLKRFETETINKQKEAAKNTANKAKQTQISSKEVKVKNESITQKQETETVSNDDDDPANESTKLLEADFLENEEPSDKAADNEKQPDFDDDDEFVRPMQVKPEEKSSNKQKWDICCDDCEKFIKFFAGKMNDEQIEQHLRNCKKRRERELLGHETPEDFWNPLMLSFADNDPRNEVLIDDRFKNKKRGE